MSLPLIPPGPILGHVGDGNFHSLIIFKDEEKDRVQNVAVDISMYVDHSHFFLLYSCYLTITSLLLPHLIDGLEKEEVLS